MKKKWLAARTQLENNKTETHNIETHKTETHGYSQQ
jgi:hypothetical protein